MSARLLCGDVRAMLATLPDASVQCVVTSPPYFAVRNYGLPPLTWADGWVGSLGLEPTIEQYITHCREVFPLLWRVLRSDGTCWVNIGDTFNANQGSGFDTNQDGGARKAAAASPRSARSRPKDLMLVPFRLALALQADGWWVRQTIIWHKPNPMPESVTDRPTTSHEYIFLLTKSERYYYDAEAIKEPNSDGAVARFGKNDSISIDNRKYAGRDGESVAAAATRMPTWLPTGRNKRSVWTVPTEAYPEAHFATYPTKLIEPCILAGTPERGACPACGAPWRRMSETSYINPGNRTTNGPRSKANRIQTAGYAVRLEKQVDTLGWEPGCRCDAGDPVPCAVLDPFVGSGTTGVVALRHGRDFIGIDLNREYIELARRRIYAAAPLFNVVEVS